MSEISMSDADIIAQCASGMLVLDIERFDRSQDDDKTLVTRCIALHNGRRINLLSLIGTSHFSNLDGHRFFVLQHFFCDAIPFLESPTDEMLHAIEALVEKGGNDLAAGMPNDALRSWLAKDPERAKQVVDMADDDCASRSLTFAIEALADIELARVTIARSTDTRRLSGITALGRLKSPDAMQAEISANLLLPYIKARYDDDTRCNSLTNPVITTSILVVCLRGCSKSVATEIGKLLFDPILVNYGGSAKDYLRTIKRGDRAYKQVRVSLKKGDIHLDALDAKAPINELHPSNYQRSVERIRQREMLRKIRKDADKQSIFANLVHRSTLLHGRRSMTFVAGHNDELRPVFLDLHSFGTSFEIPRMEILDPVGLNLMLIQCRSVGNRK